MRTGGESGLTECRGKAGLRRLASRRLGARDVWHILVRPCAAARAAKRGRPQQPAASAWALAEPVRAGRAGDKSVPVAVAALCASDVRPKHARSSLDAEQGEYILELERAAAAASLAAAEAFGGRSAAGAHLAAAARMVHNDVHSQQARAWLLSEGGRVVTAAVIVCFASGRCALFSRARTCRAGPHWEAARQPSGGSACLVALASELRRGTRVLDKRGWNAGK